MRITVRGWSRDLGETQIMSAALPEAEKGPASGEPYERETTYLNVEHPGDRRRTKVRISKRAELRLGGNYLLEVELSRSEIAQLFYDTHSGAMVRMVRSFIEGEENEDRARQLEQWAQFEESRRQRMAQREQAETS